MRTKYTDEQKRQIVNLHKHGTKVKDICDEYNISKTTMYTWIKEYQIFRMGDGTRITAKDYYELQRKYQKVQIDYNIIVECNCLPTAKTKYKLEAISRLDGKYTIHALCRVLYVRRSNYYHYKLRRPSETEIAKQDEVLKPIVEEIFNKTKGRIGSKKICHLIQRQGIPTSPTRVRRLMKEMNLVCRATRKGIKYNYSKSSVHCKNLLNRNFEQTEPNIVWVSDITYVRVNRKAYYLCVYIDLFSRKVIGYTVDDNQETNMVIEAFKMANATRKPNGGTILHSDQGMQYRCYEFRKLIKRNGFKSSYSKAGCPYDNAVAESFFRMFKQEEVNHHYYKSFDDLKDSIDEYIYFYNNERPHEKLGNLTPNEKEEQYFKSQT